MGFRLFQLVRFNIRWAPVASRPSVGYNFDWARHLWDMTHQCLLSHSLFVFLPLSLSAWGWGHLVYVGGARHADWSRSGPGQSAYWNTTHFVYCLVLATEPHWSPSAEHFTFGTFLIYTCTDELRSGRGVASWIKLSYQNISGEIINFLCMCMHMSVCVSAFFSHRGGVEKEGEEADTGDWEATVRTCQRKLEGVSGPSPTGKQESEEASAQSCVKRKRISLLLQLFWLIAPLISGQWSLKLSSQRWPHLHVAQPPKGGLHLLYGLKLTSLTCLFLRPGFSVPGIATPLPLPQDCGGAWLAIGAPWRPTPHLSMTPAADRALIHTHSWIFNLLLLQGYKRHFYTHERGAASSPLSLSLLAHLLYLPLSLFFSLLPVLLLAASLYM